ncbi:MAG: formiminoglutamase [Cytophagales bacterium]|nr:MAG: formiminoglutamase [Cytophagales bacterium]
MLNFKLFFDLIGKEDFAQITDVNALVQAVQFAGESTIRWKNIDIALVGLNFGGSADSIRKIFFSLQKSSVNYRILDLGNLRLNDDIEENYLKISEVCKGLMQENVLPILIGAANDYALGQYFAYQDLEKMIYVLNIDSKLDIREESSYAADKYVSKILLHQPNYLFSLGLLGYQTYLNSNEALEMCKKLNFDMLSVGEMRQNKADIEPMIRVADMISIDISAIRRSDAPAQPHAFHFGLTGEEITQIAWYAGLNDKLSSFGIYGYRADLDTNNQTAEVISVMLWYFIEGFYYRKGEFPLRENFYVKYIIPFGKEKTELTFYKSILSERWWVEIPAREDKKSTIQRKILVPCSYADYEEALAGNLPDRWLKALIRQ